MVSESADPVSTSTRSCPSEKSQRKVPRKIHKAEREKLKRDHLNELFLDLEKTLDSDQPNNGKASILRDTIKLVAELLSQVDNLKKENVALLSESNYVTIEKNELVEETSALDAQIKRLQKEIDERSNCSNLNASLPQTDLTTQVSIDHVAFPLVGHAPESTSVVGPMFVLPLHHEVNMSEVNMPKVPSSVSKPRPRYPSSSDSWPSHILTK